MLIEAEYVSEGFREKVALELAMASARAHAILGTMPLAARLRGWGDWVLQRTAGLPAEPGMCRGVTKQGRDDGLLLRCQQRAKPGSLYCGRHMEQEVGVRGFRRT